MGMQTLSRSKGKKRESTLLVSKQTSMGRKFRREEIYVYVPAFLVAQMVKNLPAVQETWA